MDCLFRHTETLGNVLPSPAGIPRRRNLFGFELSRQLPQTGYGAQTRIDVSTPYLLFEFLSGEHSVSIC